MIFRVQHRAAEMPPRGLQLKSFTALWRVKVVEGCVGWIRIQTSSARSAVEVAEGPPFCRYPGELGSALVSRFCDKAEFQFPAIQVGLDP